MLYLERIIKYRMDFDCKNDERYLMGCGDDENKQNEDALLWEIATRDVKPYKKSKNTEKPLPSQNKKETAAKRKIHRPDIQTSPVSGRASADTEQRLPDIDRRTDEKLRRGQMKINASLDLHGMNKYEAWEALQNFIPSCYEGAHRSLLVITGKGRAGRPGILREHIPQWLQETPLLQYVLQFHQARPKDGGDGAFYVLLRKKRR